MGKCRSISESLLRFNILGWIVVVIYNNVSFFFCIFSRSFFMLYNTFLYQRLMCFFSFSSQIILIIFCQCLKKVYFCIRLARGAELFLLTY